jgi:hypothetical protein
LRWFERFMEGVLKKIYVGKDFKMVCEERERGL